MSKQIAHLLPKKNLTSLAKELHSFLYHHPKNSLLKKDCLYSETLPKNWDLENIARAYVRFLSGAELEELSYQDILNYFDSEKDWRLEPSFGSLAEKIGEEHKAKTEFNCMVKKNFNSFFIILLHQSCRYCERPSHPRVNSMVYTRKNNGPPKGR